MMPKAFGGAAARPAMTANGSPGGIRPMPRPEGLGGVELSQGTAKRGGLMGQMTPERYDMAMQMLQSAMSGAAGSNNPALAFLAPIIGGITGSKLQDKRDAAVSEQQRAMTEGLMGGPLNPQAQQAMEVLNNPDAPAYLKTIAAAMFKQNAVPVGQMAQPARRAGGSGSRSGGGGGKPAGGGRPQKLTYISRDPDGVVRGYNAATGKREVVPNADTAPAPASASPAARSLPPLPADPVLPRDPATGGDDDLINKYLGN